MPSTVKILAALLLLPACAPLPVDQGEGEVTVGTTTGEGSSTGEDAGSSSSTSTSTSSGSSSTDDGSSSTSTGENTGEAETSSSTGSTTDDSTGEGSSSTGAGVPGEVCGDGVEDLYEACDDGTPGGGDGCSNDCKRWDWLGIAEDVAEVDLIQWVPCWSSPYSEQTTATSLLEACTAKQIAIGCHKVGATTYTVLAHADRSAILTGIPEIGDTWTVINGSAWQWSHDQIAFFPPAKPWQGKDCNGALCWPRIGDTIIPWGRCGDLEMGLDSAPLWERVVLQSFF